MPALFIHDVRIVNPGKSVLSGDVLVSDGCIREVGAGAPGALQVEGHWRLLTPGLIDVHTHGIEHSIYGAGAEATRTAARALGRFGVTTVLPTIVPGMEDGMLERLAEIADTFTSISHVNIPSFHLEGPFKAVKDASCPTLPGDLDLLNQFIQACDGRVAAMSVSPDTPNVIAVIHRLRELGIVVFLAHTRANVEKTEAALEAGARHATHFHDVFHAPPETEPGADDDLVLWDHNLTAAQTWVGGTTVHQTSAT